MSVANLGIEQSWFVATRLNRPQVGELPYIPQGRRFHDTREGAIVEDDRSSSYAASSSSH